MKPILFLLSAAVESINPTKKENSETKRSADSSFVYKNAPRKYSWEFTVTLKFLMVSRFLCSNFSHLTLLCPTSFAISNLVSGQHSKATIIT